MRGDKVGDQVLFLSCFCRIPVEQLLEAVIGPDAGFHHLTQRARLGVFRCDLQIASHMMGYQFPDIFRGADRQVVAQAGGDKDPFDAGQATGLAIEPDQRSMICAQIDTDPRVDTGEPATGRLDLGILASHPVHVGGGTAKV